ncbi:MAG: hypothetical protein PVF83_11445 [Anaerolineales bacterium]|jgi:hypothetical protein
MNIFANQFLEFGKCYEKRIANDNSYNLNIASGEFYNLAYTPGMEVRSESLIEALSFPSDSEFLNRLGEVSAAFIQVSEEGKEFAFVQLQARQEKESDDYDVNKSGGRLFTQVRFTILNYSQINELFARGLCVFYDLLENTDDDFRLRTYDDRTSSKVSSPADLEIFLPDKQKHRSWVYDNSSGGKTFPRAGLIIQEIARAVQDNRVAVVYPEGLSFINRLLLVQAVVRLLLPVRDKPISFALDYVVHPDNHVDLTFLREEDPISSKVSRVITLDNMNIQELDDYIAQVYKFLIVNDLNWEDRHQKIYQDEIRKWLIENSRFDDAADWLMVTVFSGELLPKIRAILELKGDLPQTLFENRFLPWILQLTQENKIELLEGLLKEKNVAENLLYALVESELFKKNYSSKQWVKQVIEANIDVEDKEPLLFKYQDELGFDQAKNLLSWAQDKTQNVINRSSENIVYKYIKAMIVKNCTNAYLMVNAVPDLPSGHIEEKEYAYWGAWMQLDQKPVSDLDGKT